jgi:predicted ATPase/DNA-binding SARP family transcriptional activator
MLFRVLGPVEAEGANGAVPLGGPRHRVLLATLLTAPGSVVPAERLIEALWGDAPPRSAPEMLHVRISELRKRLSVEPGLIVTRRPGYLLDVDPEHVDAHRFEQAVVEGRRALSEGDAAGAAARLAAGLGLWRGQAFAEIATRGFAQPHVARLENLHVQAVEDRIAADLERGAHREVLAELESLVRAHPLHERYRHQLMLALYRDGRQGAALQVYQDGVDLLRDELGVDPGRELQDLQLAILRQERGLTAAAATPPAPPPRAPDLPVPLTSFVGRDAEVEATCAQLDSARLVTLTGIGGAGKSRLAIEVAQLRRDAFPDGVRIVELAPVGDPALVTATVAAATGARERPQQPLRDALVDHLRPASALLVLDNCEHLVDEVANLTRHLLARCPALRILCTSRERLDLTGEVVMHVPGLAVPGPDDRGAEAIGASSAVRLFVDRARAAQPRFRLTDDNADTVARIALGLDGLPLAIELAAARTAAFAVGRIAAGLQDRFRLLSRGSREAVSRHQTLRAVVDWSYGLLTEQERRLFDRLAVFVGGFTYEAAAAVATDEPADLLARLVDKSLVVADMVESPDYRYRMLETLRAYGLDELERRSEAAPVRDAHARYYRELATAAVPGLRSVELATWLDRLRIEHGNLRAAMEWSLRTGDAETAAGIAAALYAFWDLRGFYAEGRDWLRRVLADGREISDATRARALMGTATLAVIQGDLEEAVDACRAAAELSRAADDGAGLSHALQYLGFVATLAGEAAEARLRLDDAERVAAAAGARWEHGWSHVFLAALALSEGRFADADADVDRAEQIVGADGDQELLAWVALVHGISAWGMASPRPRAAQWIALGAARFHALHGQWGISMALLTAGLLLTAVGRDRPAVRMFAAADAVRESAGVAMMPFAVAWVDSSLSQLRSRLAPETFAAEWAAGQASSADEGVRAAQAELASVTDPR